MEVEGIDDDDGVLEQHPDGHAIRGVGVDRHDVDLSPLGVAVEVGEEHHCRRVTPWGEIDHDAALWVGEDRGVDEVLPNAALVDGEVVTKPAVVAVEGDLSPLSDGQAQVVLRDTEVDLVS